VRHPSLARRLGWLAEANWFVLLPFALLLGAFLLWWRRGRDALGERTVIPEWRPPDGLRAAEVGVVIDDRLDPRDLTAAIVDLAVRGAVRIVEEEDGGFRLRRRGGAGEPAGLEPFERDLLEALFGGRGDEVRLKDLERKFYAAIPGLRRRVLDDLVAKGHFPRAPDVVAARWAGLAALALGALAVLGGMARWHVLYWVALAVCAVPLLVLAARMPRRTRKGLDALARIRGMEAYLETAERERMKEMPLSHFEALLPYAVALDLHERWARAFQGLFDRPPEWVETRRSTWDWASVHTVMTGMNRSVGTSLYATPRTESSGGGWGGRSSGGSGFSGGSGGGFGGGGGGGW
jgi:uncharacterized membrane protein YgcG